MLPHNPQPTAFLGDLPDFVHRVAHELAPLLLRMVQVEPPLDKTGCCKFLKCSPNHLDELISAGLPCRDISAPGSKSRMLRFWPHELAGWQGTAEQRGDVENGEGK